MFVNKYLEFQSSWTWWWAKMCWQTKIQWNGKLQHDKKKKQTAAATRVLSNSPDVTTTLLCFSPFFYTYKSWKWWCQVQPLDRIKTSVVNIISMTWLVYLSKYQTCHNVTPDPLLCLQIWKLQENARRESIESLGIRVDQEHAGTGWTRPHQDFLKRFK